jgi:hypothetical protein
LSAGTSACAQSPDSAFLDGLRERRLFELAERHCLDRLAEKQLAEPLRTELIVDHIRTLASWAIHAPAGERDALWRRARQVAAEAVRARPPPQRLALVRVQDALTPLAEGELARHEFEAGALQADRLEPSRQLLREASDLLESLDKELTAQIPLRRRDPPREGELSAEALSSVQQQARRELARAYRNRALLFTAGSDDRLALLLRAAETLQAVLAQLAADDPLAREVQVDLAECQRRLARYDEAAQLLAGLAAEGVEPAVRQRAVAELIRLAIAQGNTAAAERLIEQGRTIDGRSSELDFACFEGYLSLARAAGQAKDAAAARQYQDQAAELARLLDSTHGPYWGRRADQLLVKSLPLSRGVVNVTLLARAADTLYLQREFAQAMAAYDDAAAQARITGELAASFELSYKAALVEQSRREHAAAARRFRTLGKSLPTHPEAPAAHLASAWHAAQLVKRDLAAERDYEAILREHLAAWPGHESAAQARVWLGRLLESQDRPQDAVVIYALVPRSSAHYSDAVTGLAAAWHKHLAKLAAAGEPTKEAAVRAVEQLAGDEFTTWSDADRTAALAAAQITLAYLPAQAAEAERLLRQAIEGAPAAPQSWQAAARCQLVVALASQPGKQEEARDALRSIGNGSAAELFAVLTALSAVIDRVSADNREQTAKLQLVAAESLEQHRAKLTDEQRHSLDRLIATALAAAGRRTEAIAAYKSLTAAYPDDAATQEGYGDLLLMSDDRPSLEAALAQWRSIAARSRPRTDRWYRAKYSIAMAQFKLGDNESAKSLLRYVVETPPGLAGTSWQAQYEELLRRTGFSARP